MKQLLLICLSALWTSSAFADGSAEIIYKDCRSRDKVAQCFVERVLEVCSPRDLSCSTAIGEQVSKLIHQCVSEELRKPLPGATGAWHIQETTVSGGNFAALLRLSFIIGNPYVPFHSLIISVFADRGHVLVDGKRVELHSGPTHLLDQPRTPKRPSLIAQIEPAKIVSIQAHDSDKYIDVASAGFVTAYLALERAHESCGFAIEGK